VSCLDKDGYSCLFGDGRCLIECNGTVISIAFRRNDLYLISLRESVNSVCVGGNLQPGGGKHPPNPS
jgi:hypothetical protein